LPGKSFTKFKASLTPDGFSPMEPLKGIRFMKGIKGIVENVLEGNDLFIFVPIGTHDEENNVAMLPPAVADQFMKPGKSRRN
jgi:hypothetical protein